MLGATPIGRVHAAAFRVPTDRPEADGTLTWDSTVIVVVDVEAGGRPASATPIRRGGGCQSDRRHVGAI